MKNFFRSAARRGERFWVRSAAQADIEEFVATKNRCWEQSYRDLLDDDALQRLAESTPGQIEFWRSQLRRGSHLALAEDTQGNVVGVAAATSTESGCAAAEVNMLYVEHSVQGRGIARALLRQVLPPGAAECWVLAENTALQSFYQQEGFVATGKERTEHSWAGMDRVVQLVHYYRAEAGADGGPAPVTKAQ